MIIITPFSPNTAKLWDAASGELIASFDHQDLVYDAAFSPDGTRIVTASADHSAKLWDASSSELIASFAHQDGLYHATFSPGSSRILTASADKPPSSGMRPQASSRAQNSDNLG